MTESKHLLLQNWDTPFGIPPFDKIKSEDYLSAFEEAMEIHKSEVEEIVSSKDAPTFENTLEALERSGSKLTQVASLFFAVNGANTDDVLKETKILFRQVQILMNRTRRN